MFFVRTREHLSQGLKFLCKIGKILHFCNFLKELFCKFSKILQRPGGSAPGPPTRPAIPLNPRNFFLRTPLGPLIFFFVNNPDILNFSSNSNEILHAPMSTNFTANYFTLCCVTIISLYSGKVLHV